MFCRVLDVRIHFLIALMRIMISSGALMVTGRSLSASARANSDPADLGVRWQPPVESQLLPTRNSRAVNADAGTQSSPEQMLQRRIKVPESDDLSELQGQSLQLEAAVELPGQGTSAAVAPSPRTTVMKCLGTTTVTRACHFEDVYYELESKRFVYFGPPGVAPELFGQSHKAGEPWLRLIRCGTVGAASTLHTNVTEE